jgi:membrane-bound lytic murein transglycosylase MltF
MKNTLNLSLFLCLFFCINWGYAEINYAEFSKPAVIYHYDDTHHVVRYYLKDSADSTIHHHKKLVSHHHTEAPVISQTSKKFNDDWIVGTKVNNAFMHYADTDKLLYVLQKSSEMQLPASVALLPLIESDYHSHAVSSKGALGPWQLMPQTARSLGITPKQSFNFKLATNAALKCLSQLHDKFGNWTLAIAAYNAGETRVMNALKENPDATTINELDLPRETKNYIAYLRTLTDRITERS